MKLLAFDTSTETLRVAVQDAAGRVHAHEGAGGAMASSTLLPTILTLLAGAGLALRELDAIVFGRGPGQFTGLRTACAVAQGLAWGAGVPVLPVDTLLAVAEDARARTGGQRIVAALDARMDEAYWASWHHADGRWTQVVTSRLGAPESLDVPEGWLLAGNAFAAFGSRIAALRQEPAAPTAEALLRLAPALIAAGKSTDAAHAMPLYIRDKVALTIEERAAARAAVP